MISDATPANYTLNCQNNLKRFELKDKIRQERQKIVLKSASDDIDNNDLLITNNLDASFTNENTLGTLPDNRIDVRYYQENYVYVNISSRQRQQYNERPVVAADRATFPNKQIWDEHFDKTTGTFVGDLELCCSTFNNLCFNQEFPNFFLKDNTLYIRVPIDTNPNQYSVILAPARTHIRSIRLVSVEGPRHLDVVTAQNNLLLLDVINPCTGESFKWDDDMQFAILLIPIGYYTVESLLKMIIAILNQTVQNALNKTNNKDNTETNQENKENKENNKENNKLKSKCEPISEFECDCKPFSYFYDIGTGQIDIMCEFLFHIKFWFSTTNEQFNLWSMLGYNNPYPQDVITKQPIYTNNFTNLVEIPSPLIAGYINKFPYRVPNLDLYDYVYLAIQNMAVIQDASVSDKYDVFAKVYTKEKKFISSTKVYGETLDKLESINVTWLDQFGNLLDLRMEENSFLLEIVEYQDRLKDSAFSSQRGLRNFDEEVSRVQYKYLTSNS